MNHFEVGKWMLAAACLNLSVACSAPVEDAGVSDEEDPGEITEGIWEAGCNSYPSDSIGTGRFVVTTDATYDKVDPVCSKTWIARANDFDMTDLAAVMVADWATDITSQAVCNNLWMAAQLFVKQDGKWVALTAATDLDYRSTGIWNTVIPSWPHCINFVDFDDSLFEAGRSYRIHATARTSRYGSTRPMRFLKGLK